jgi:hypothetical protein
VRHVVGSAVVVFALGACSLFVGTGDLAGGSSDDAGGKSESSQDDSVVPPPDVAPATDAARSNDDVTSPPPVDARADDGPAPSAYRATVLADAPIAYWRMGVVVGTDVPDETGTNNVLTLHQGCAAGEPGALANDPDTAVTFDGVSAYATAMDARPFDFPDGHPFTLEVWARYDPLDQGDTYGHLITNLDQVDATASDRNGYIFYLAQVLSPPLAGFEWDVPGAQQLCNMTALPLHAWGHYVAVFDGTGIVAYVNGIAGNRTQVGPDKITARAVPFVVGALGPGRSRFAGALDEVAVYDKPLTLERILAHYKVGVGQ